MIMANRRPRNRVKNARVARGWSQAELALRAGLSRTGLGAIEAGRLVPSVAAALALSRALGCHVEDLFQADAESSPELIWAEPPATQSARFWVAEIRGRQFAYPVQEASGQSVWHDGVNRDGRFEEIDRQLAGQTVVVASCDPAASLMAFEYSRATPFRMIVLRRSSRQSLRLLGEGKVHVAGVHLSTTGAADENRAAVRELVGDGFRLLKVARWEEGLAIAPHVKGSSVRTLLNSRLRWVGRDEGSGARACLDELLAGRPAPQRCARDHRGVATAIGDGWADIGVCVRLASEEAGLRFLQLRRENYDLCFASDMELDPRVAALLALLRSAALRRKLADLPGYECRQTGDVRDA
jgi:molybdate-binding protein/DNA-binding XRE family transcriptional regulator